MVKNDKEVVLKCVGVQPTKRYLKYKLPAELFDDEEPEFLFSGRHIYVLKSGENGDCERVVFDLNSG